MNRDWVESLAARYGAEVAIEAETCGAPQKIRYRELPDTLRATGAGWPETGIFCTREATGIGHALALLAAGFRGLTVFPLDARTAEGNARKLAEKAGARWFWKGGGIAATGFSTAAPAEERLPGEGSLVATSGSSGEPKIAFLPWESHFANAAGANQNIPLGPGCRYLVDLPLWHVSGMGALIRALDAGACAVFGGRPGEITHRSAVPLQLARWLDAGVPPAKLEALLVGGAPLSPALRARATAAGWPLHATYGMTETASQVCTTPCLLRSGADPSSCGKPLGGREVKIAADGEILVRGKILFSGYWDAAEGLSAAVDAGGWFATGDLGEWNPLQELRVLGRKDRMFVCAGENIRPEKIEAAALGLRGIRRAFVVGEEDGHYGMRPVIFVDGEGDAAEWKAQMRDLLSGLEVPARWFRWPEDSRGGAGAGEKLTGEPPRKPEAKFFRRLVRDRAAVEF